MPVLGLIKAPVLLFGALVAGQLDSEAAGESDRPPPGQSDTPEWEALRRRLAQDRVRMRYLKNEESSIIHGLEALERALAEQRKSAAALVDQIRHLESRIARLDARYAETERNLAELHARAGSRAAAMHRLKRTRIADLLERTGAPSQIRKLREWLRLVLAHDVRLIAELRRATETARLVREEAARDKDALGEARSALADEIEQTAVLREERTALLEAVRHERRTSERLAAELALSSRKLERELGVVRGAGPAPKPAPGGFEAQAGKLPWPVSGRVEVPFGKKIDPASGMVMVQKGIDLRAPLATAVRAVFTGRVVYAGWFEGFGRLVILDHGGGYYTLYAHLESIEVQKDREVNAYQVVGLVGDSGSTKGAYLYFEVRRGKEAVDPVRWLSP